jgi:hypothetical protein
MVSEQVEDAPVPEQLQSGELWSATHEVLSGTVSFKVTLTAYWSPEFWR